MDFCVAVDGEVAPTSAGIVDRRFPGGRCAVVRHHGSRENGPGDVRAPRPAPRRWQTIFFRFAEMGPNVREKEMITAVYLPLR